MEQSVRLRTPGREAAVWLDAFEIALGEDPVLAGSSVSLPTASQGLGAIDPTIAVALIGAGAQVLAAAIAAFVAIQRPSKQEREASAPVIVVEGARGSLRLTWEMANDRSAVAAEIRAASKRLGQVREVVVSIQ